ncbi:MULTISPECIES: formate--tetrahydrofolate ligase [unclassified Paenibacillus]|uniref:formate--tetrahydrofolate ligase n=1 Tax=unclassified Paenibacillus TaxID=185978 RepID=UPI00240594B5|nr:MULTISPECIES: formate--tetrahydrofolate ligase [unclassified Paenibacillus]MDF9840048.1 formate--tetrahydrofolate ligase [Paenibacillus sp. PastF-2]MDF9846630.1 formate--tetrahydrofolate ligase [Paenibacillus sp. PastM-2]MDF9853022.1 formate--tetrahydrofolate ligase [Paenibacillus sp. PastF-1]MDH6478474.1 formate--tetrahydrofolate ligase [Paenibacillus sp. PastH-2]MDH6506028.1 formate--tetrahydrofolate ligase [Paenibacillus sp. PastM-3]
MRLITEVAAAAGISGEHLELYGKYKSKLAPSLWEEVKNKPDGKLVLVTAVNPTPAGEGKTLTTIGLSQALNAAGIKTVAALREPSLGPCLGMKGGATGGGKAQIVPADDINLHFTGDIHAVTSAHNLLSAMIDNHIFQGNALGLDPQRIVWKRVMDMNDRSLRNIVTGLGDGNGTVRESGFQITTASEIMAVLCLCDDLADLKKRLSRMLVGYDMLGQPVTAKEIGAVEAMTALLKEAVKPNLVQTLEGTPVIIHGGPFANIAHGCSSVIGTRYALKLGEVVVTEAGFGADLGAEKFMDIKCRQAGLAPDAAVLVVTVKSLKYNGGVRKEELHEGNRAALLSGLANMERHIENLGKFGVPVLVALNHFEGDAPDEVDAVLEACRRLDVPAAVSKVWAEGGAGGLELARELKKLLDHAPAGTFAPLYEDQLDIPSKINTIVTEIYRGTGVAFSPAAKRSLAVIEKLGLQQLQVCMAKTPYSFSDQPRLLGAPEGFTMGVRDITLSLGAGFAVVITGNIVTMPGLPAKPAAEGLLVDEDGVLHGLE